MVSASTNRRPSHIFDFYYDRANDGSADLQIWPYTNALSYRASELLELHVSTNVRTFDLEIARDGLALESMHQESGISGAWRATPEDCYARGCGWPVTWRFVLPEDWQPGGWLLTLTVRRNDEIATYHHIITVGASANCSPLRCFLSAPLAHGLPITTGAAPTPMRALTDLTATVYRPCFRPSGHGATDLPNCLKMHPAPCPKTPILLA